MNKKVTTIAGIALGASLLAGAGYGLYTLIAKKFSRKAVDGTDHQDGLKREIASTFIGNGLIKSKDLYGLGYVDNGLVAGGLYRGHSVN